MARKKIKKKKGFLENYKNSWKIIKESKKFILIIIGIFLFFTLVGFFIPPPINLSKWISNYLEQIMSQISGLSAIQMISFIFFNNLKSSFAGMIFGILLGIFPIFAALFNGYILGFVLNKSVNANGILVLWKLLPHGIFELPAVFISLGLGLRLGIKVLSNRRKGELKKIFYDSIKVFLLVVIPLLIIAAVIEGILITLIL